MKRRLEPHVRDEQLLPELPAGDERLPSAPHERDEQLNSVQHE